MSIKFDDLALLSLFGKVRRQVNLMATAKCKPMGIGPKQAVLVRRLAELKSTCAMDLARSTQTDPAATGKVIDSLIRKGWIKRTDDPDDRRRWRVMLTSKGEAAAQKIDSIYKEVADDFCFNISNRQKVEFYAVLGEISKHLDKISIEAGELK